MIPNKKSLMVLMVLHLICTYLTLCRGEINLTEYQQMPALYKSDNFHDCMTGKEAKYCMILVQLQPNNDSPVWQQIQSMNADKFNYRHDVIFRGLCVERCKFVWKNNGISKITDNGLLQNEHTKMFEMFHNRTLDRTMRYNYQQELHQCINQEYMENYNLTTKTFINYCIDTQQSTEKTDAFHLSVLVLVLLVVINISSSIYDATLKPQLLKENEKQCNYYEVKHSDKVTRYLTAFSLCRNYKRLVVANKSDIGMDLSFLDGFRSILSLLIVFEHAFLLQFLPSENPEFFESLWQKLIPRMLLHSLIWLELFFVLSGLLLYVKFEKTQYITPKSTLFDCVNVFVRLFVSRYLRYLPSLVFVIMFTANITEYHGQNTLARNLMDGNCLACRESWLQNVLMINNYFMKSSCLMHTWYIAADFQLYGIFLIILIITSKYPQLKVAIFAGVAFLAAVINFGLNYILNLESIFMLLPESYRYFYFTDIKTARHLYFSTYTNLHSFLLGIVCGFIYMKYLRKNPDNKKRLGKILRYSPLIGWLCILGILYLGTTIIGHKETTIWTAAYGLLHRHVGLAIVAVIVILRGMCLGGGFLELPVFRFLARLSFQVYLWQIVVLLNIVVYLNEPTNQSYAILQMLGVFVYVVSNLIGFVVALFVEYPAAEVVSIFNIEKKI